MTHGYESPMQIVQVPTGPAPPVGWDPDDHIWLPVQSASQPAALKTITLDTATLTIPPNVLTDITFTSAAFNTSAGWIAFTPPSTICTVLQTAFYRFTCFVDWGNDVLTGTYRSSAVRWNGNQDLDPFIGLPPVTSPGVDTEYSWSIMSHFAANGTFGMRLLHDATAPLTRVIASMTVEVVGI